LALFFLRQDEDDLAQQRVLDAVSLAVSSGPMAAQKELEQDRVAFRRFLKRLHF